MRVNVQLIDAQSGNHLWADRFDKPLADFLDMQDEIVARLANALNAQLVVAEAHRAERSQNPDSMDLCFQARAWYYKGITHDYVAEARALYERALALDPANVWALLGIATMDMIVAVIFYPDDRAARFAAAETAATKAVCTRSRECVCPYVPGLRPNLHKPRLPGHQGMRTGPGTRPRSWLMRTAT